MPKVKGPLFSLHASGTLARLITFENRADMQRVRRVASYSSPRTALQSIVTTKVAAMAESWSTWDDTNRTLWNARAIDFTMTGYALYWREWFAQHIDAPAHPTLP
jgi:hypothetical protein